MGGVRRSVILVGGARVEKKPIAVSQQLAL